VRILGINTIEVKAEAFSPDFAYNLVNTLTKIFIEAYTQREIAMVKSTMEFNYDQIAEFKEKLEQSEKKLARFRRKGIMDEEEDEVLTVEASDRINEAIVAIDLTMKGKRDYLNYLNGKLDKGQLNVTYPRTPMIKNVFKEIDQKIDQMGALLKRYVWNSSELIKVNRNINILRESIKNEIENLYLDKFSDVNAQTFSLLLNRAITLVDLEIANRKKEVLTSILNYSRFNVSETQDREVELARLQEEVTSNQSIYKLFLEQSQGIQIEEAIQHAYASNRFQILEPPVKPIEPNNLSLIVLGVGILFFASSAGIGIVYVREYLDRSIRTVEEAESYFNVQVIGVIPHLNDEPFLNQEIKKNNNRKREDTWLNHLAIKNIIRAECVQSRNIIETPLV
jgi:uncharacterized protein involved in exopolysaccharide biosynthesis